MSTSTIKFIWPKSKIFPITCGKFRLAILILLLCCCIVYSGKAENSSGAASQKVSDYLDIAALFKESGEYTKAIDVLSAASNFSQDERIFRYLGRLEFLRGRPANALDFFERIKVKSWLDYFYRGLLYEALGALESAAASYRNSVNLKNNTASLFRLSKLYLRQKQYRQAAESFQKVIAQDSSIRLAYYYCGECLFKLGDNEEAYRFLSKAAKFYPESTAVQRQLSAVKSKLGDDFFQERVRQRQKERETVKLSAYRPQEEERVKVGLGRELSEFSFSSPQGFIIRAGGVEFQTDSAGIYTLTLKGNRIILNDSATGSPAAQFSVRQCEIFPSGEAEDKYPFYVLDVAYGERDFWHKKIDRAYRGGLEVIIQEGKLTLVNIVDVEDYLLGILAAEIPAHSSPEALKAQAVAARTLVFKNRGRHKKAGFDFCADVHCQVYQGMSAETPATNAAVRQTRGEIIVYNNEPVEAFYHSNCGGCLCADTFGKSQYLTERIDAFTGQLPAAPYQEELWFFEHPDVFCAHSSGTNFRWQRVYDRQDCLIAFGFEPKTLKRVAFKEKGDCFHYTQISIETASSRRLLESGLKIRDYFDKLRSSAFKLEIKLSGQNEPELFIFWGAGFGHGTGLCQEGAANMAEQGYSYRQILEHYYPRTTLKDLY